MKSGCLKRAAEDAGGGGEDGLRNYLERQADANPQAFMGLLGKVLPKEITAEITEKPRSVVRMPAECKDTADWLRKYGPPEQKPANEPANKPTSVEVKVPDGLKIIN